MSVLVLLTGEIHRVTMRLSFAPHIAFTACHEWIAMTGSRPDPTSVYQRTVFPKAFHPTRCPRCEP